MSARYTHAGDDAKRVAIEGVSQWASQKQNSRSSERLQVLEAGGGIEPPTLEL